MTGENSEIPKLGGTIFSIVATGDSAKDWVPNGYSIGVNDAFKFGRPTDALVLCNKPATFAKDRLQTIINSKPSTFYSHKADWAQWFPSWKKLRLHTWSGTLHDHHRSDGPSAYSFNSSPIIAITLAYNLGAKEIIIWGVDMKNHHSFNDKNPETKKEVQAYLEVFAALKEKGAQVYLGAKGGVFDDHLPIYLPEWLKIILPGLVINQTE